METVAPPRQLKIGTIIDKTLGVLEYSAVPAAIYVAVLAPLTAAITYFTVDMTGALERLGVSLVQFVVGVTAAYLLIDAMLRKTGLRTRTDEDVFFPYFALSILYILGLIAGLIALVIPGLVIMARWSLAQPMMIARGDGVMQALGSSWERTKGNEFQIIVAVLALYVVPIAIVIACSLMFDPADPIGIGLTQFVSSIMSALGLAMGVALYGLMEGHRVSASPMG
jgi:hypothetical protein